MGNADPVAEFAKAKKTIVAELWRTRERTNALRSVACGIGGGSSGERVQSSKAPDKIPEVLARIEEQEKKAGRIRTDLMRLIALFDACISTLDKSEERVVLSMEREREDGNEDLRESEGEHQEKSRHERVQRAARICRKMESWQLMAVCVIEWQFPKMLSYIMHCSCREATPQYNLSWRSTSDGQPECFFAFTFREEQWRLFTESYLIKERKGRRHWIIW